MTEEIAVNIPELEQEINKLSPHEMAEQLLKIRVRAKVQQKKHYDPEAMKKYQQKQREKNRALKERALNTPGTKHDPATGKLFTNLWEQINHEAEQQAEARVNAEAAETVADEAND